MPDYFIHFAIAHREFRLPELLSVCECLNCPIELPQDPSERDVDRPFMVVKLDNDDAARRIAQRCILVKSIHALWGRAPTYAALHTHLQTPFSRFLWQPYASPETSFKFVLGAVQHRIPQRRVKETIESFRFMDFKGKIEMKDPDCTVGCLEEYRVPEDPKRRRSDGDGDFREVFFGRLIGEDGEARQLIRKFDIKQRVFYGNTSMEAEVSLLMANQALAAPGKIMYDPFAGTGSMLYTAAHFGALVFGSDVDGRQMRGKGLKSSGTLAAAAQYGIQHRLMDSLTFDVTRNPWRRGSIFDAIVTDPPYGVRAGAKRLGGNPAKGALREGPIILPDGIAAHTKPTYVPPTQPYELSDLAQDLVYFARYMLVPGGRLVFFLPTVTDEYADVDVPRAKGMQVVANSLQDFGKWGRRLITMVKTTSDPVDPPRFLGASDVEIPPIAGELAADASTPAENLAQVPAHKDFRVKYFSKFEPAPAVTPATTESSIETPPAQEPIV